MLSQFDLKKTIQAAAVLAIAHDGLISRLRLLKLLYMADRETLASIGDTITGDRVVAMENGPVLSNTYDLIKDGTDSARRWNEYFENQGRLYVRLRADPGVGALSRFEVDKLKEVSREHAEEDDWKVAEITHHFEEWVKNQPAPGSMNPIPLDDRLAAVGLLDRKEELLTEEEGYKGVDKLLAGVE